MSECKLGGNHVWMLVYEDGKPVEPVTMCGKCGEPKKDNQEDIINTPQHYTGKNGMDVIGFSELQFPKEELKGFYRINCLKYITRFDRKGGLEDLKKASFYLNKLLEMENEHEKA